MKRTSLAAVLLLLVCGCTGKNELPAPDPNAAIIAEIQRQMSELERSSAAELTNVKAALDKASRESVSSVRDVQQQILLKDQRIAGLETQIQQLQSELKALKKAQEQQKAELAAAPAPVPAPAPVADSFPVRVFGVEGRKIVTGNHMTTRQVETEEVYKDEFGRKTKRIVPEDVQVDDYGYQVGFAVENTTTSPIEISASAGSKTERFVVPPGQTLDNLAVDSSMGADLNVTAGNYSRRFPVTY